MRVAKLKAVKVAGRQWPWRVYIPAAQSPTGKAQHVYGETREHGETRARDLIGFRKTHGELVGELSQHDLAMAVKSVELLKQTGVPLLDAVAAFVAHHEKRTASKTLSEAFDAFQRRKGLSKDYADSLRHTKSRAEPLLDRPIVDITPEDLEEVLKGLPPSTRNLRINRLRSVFKAAVKKGWISDNPANRLDLDKEKREEVEVYTPDEVERLLCDALENDDDLVPYLAIGFFCGLRPEREIFHLNWKDVHVRDKRPELIVRPELSKTRRRRAVEISPNCLAWIDHVLFGVPLSGKLWPHSFTTLVRKRAANHKRTGVKVIQDGMRHTFCSAHLAKHKDINRLLIQSGHADPKLLWRHYYRVMSEAAAEQFWAIAPKA
jgi:integrase